MTKTKLVSEAIRLVKERELIEKDMQKLYERRSAIYRNLSAINTKLVKDKDPEDYYICFKQGDDVLVCSAHHNPELAS